MQKKFPFIIVSLLFMIGGVSLLALPETAGQSGGVFLKIPIGARMVGLGEAFTAVADDPYALSGNMAGLARNRDLEISFSHVEWIEGVNYEYLAFSKSFFKGIMGLDSTLGAAVNYLHVPTFSSFDDWGAVKSSVNYSDLAFTVGYAQNLGFLNCGLAMRYLNQSSENTGENALTFNFGLLYDLNIAGFKMFGQEFIGRQLNLGFLLENWSMGTKLGGYGTSVQYKLGLAFRPYDNFLTSADFQFMMDSPFRINTGIEYSLNNMVFFRFGYRFLGYEVDTYTMGVGTKFNVGGKVVKLDVSFAPVSVIGNALNLSLSMKYPNQISDENRKLSSILYYKGIYYYTKGDLDKSIEMWQESLKLNPELEAARTKIQDAEKLKQLQNVEKKVKQKLIDEKKAQPK